MRSGARYTAEQAEEIAAEIVNAGGECQLTETRQLERRRERLAGRAARARQIWALVDGEAPDSGAAGEPAISAPLTYAVSGVLDLKQVETEWLPALLGRLCVDPDCDLATLRPWWFPSVVESLREYAVAWIEARRTSLAPTELSSQIFEALDFALGAGGVVMLGAPSGRIGKTFALKTWCDLHPGRARYAEVPATNDDAAFYRAIALGIGCATSLSYKGAQLRERIEAALQSSKLMLVLDKASNLWPQNNRREALPQRINWLLDALVDKGVPVALLAGPQFAPDLRMVEEKTGWSSAGFRNLLRHYQELPERLTEAELMAVAHRCLPTSGRDSIEALALLAVGSRRYLTAVENVVARARAIAGKEGRDKVTTADVRVAIEDYVIPSSYSARKCYLTKPRRRQGRRRGLRMPAARRNAGAQLHTRRVSRGER